MGREICKPEPTRVITDKELLSKAMSFNLVGKERIVVCLDGTGVDVKAGQHESQNSEQFRLGTSSSAEGNERIEVIIDGGEIKINWKVVSRGVWCSRHRIGFSKVASEN